jgi:hypothetical protein
MYFHGNVKSSNMYPRTVFLNWGHGVDQILLSKIYKKNLPPRDFPHVMVSLKHYRRAGIVTGYGLDDQGV